MSRGCCPLTTCAIFSRVKGSGDEACVAQKTLLASLFGRVQYEASRELCAHVAHPLTRPFSVA